MPLLDHTDLEDQKNVDLTAEGQALADAMATSILAWAAKRCNRPGWDKVATTEYFSPEDEQDLFYVSRLPLSTTDAVTVTTYNTGTAGYDAYTGTVRSRDTGAVKTSTCLSPGYEAVKIVYTGGYTTLPEDLDQAL